MLEQSNNFYTPSGIHVYTKDEMMNDLVDLEGVVSKLEATLPDHLRDGVEMIMPGDNTTLDVKLIVPVACEEGLRFPIREGGRTVGAGVVTKVIK